MPIKVWGVRNLNRSLHMDKVYVKFVQWVEWGKASLNQTANIDFEEHFQYTNICDEKDKESANEDDNDDKDQKDQD